MNDREAFHDFVRKRGGSVVVREGQYIESMTRLWNESWQAALAHARQQSGDAAEEAADQTKWASHYAKWAGRLYDALLDLEQAYNNKHSPQHRRAALAEARTVLAEYDAAAAPAQQEPLHDNRAAVMEQHPMLSATHFCRDCRSLWRQCDDFTFNLRSIACCDKCDNTPVGEQLVPLTATPGWWRGEEGGGPFRLLVVGSVALAIGLWFLWQWATGRITTWQ